MKRTSILAAAIGAAAVLGAGGTALAATTDDHATPSSRATDDHSTLSSRATDDDSTLSSRATDDDRGLRGDGTLDDNGAAAVSPSPSVSPSVSPSADSGFGGAVSATDAESLALAATGGGRVVRVEAETEHGTAVWSVRIVVNGVRYDLDVDRGTGDVLAHGHGADDGRPGDRHGVKAVSDDKGGPRGEAGRSRRS